uniref:ANK_REP_REGION domain-containing protein n=1 Tax=Steinernema glaseri TaxID=37863 RepID=A0A1I7YX09_9BILA
MSRKMETPSDGELHRHAKLGDVGQLKRILDSGKVHVDCVNSDGISPLMWASGSGHLAAVQILLDEGARVKLRKPDGVTALMFAAQNGHRDVVDVLIKNGADVNARTTEGGSALLAAAQNGHIAVLRHLLGCGADATQELNDGAGGAFLAAQNGHVEVLRALAEAGCDLARKRTDGISPFWMACQMGHAPAVEELRRRKQRDSARPDGATGLFKASHKGSADVVRLLLQDDDRDHEPLGILKNGESALHAAALFGHPHIVDILLKAGADPKLRNQHNDTPADLADQMNYPAIVDKLRRS